MVNRYWCARGITAVLCVCLMSLGSLTASAATQAKEELSVGDMPPDSLGRDASGDHIKLSDYRGRIVIISFWASWCGPCRKELPTLEGIQKRATRDKVVVFAVNWKESSERFRQIKRVMKNVEITLVSDSSGSLGKQYDVSAIPHMIILGRDGRVAAIHVGYGESEIPVLVDEINTLWNKPSD